MGWIQLKIHRYQVRESRVLFASFITAGRRGRLPKHIMFSKMEDVVGGNIVNWKRKF